MCREHLAAGGRGNQPPGQQDQAEDQLRDEVVRQGFDPIPVAAPQRHVERDDIIHLTSVNRAVEDCSAGGGKAVQEGLRTFVIRALEKVALR